MQTNQVVPKNFFITIASIALAYMLFEFFYNPYARLSLDEFWFAHHIFLYTQAIPYKDFLPYKTTLGYYLLSIPFYFAHGILQPLFYIKDEIALLNGIFLIIVCRWGLKFFKPFAIVLTVLTVMSSQLFLIYSADLRVDMLSSWFCLFSALALLSDKYKFSGILLSIAFLISQKALWFVAASNIALFSYWFFQERSKRTLINLLQINLAFISGVLIYFIFWSAVASSKVVWHSMFYEAYTQAKITYYAQYSGIYWERILQNGSLLFLLWPLAIYFNCSTPNKTKSNFIINIYVSTILFFLMAYQQTFPYNMVFVFPVFFLLYGEFFSRLQMFFAGQAANFKRVGLFFASYFIAMCIVVRVFELDVLTIFIIPLILSLYLMMTNITYKKLFITLISLSILTTGIIIPLSNQIVLAKSMNGNYQQQNIFLTNALLTNHDEYLAGTQLLYNNQQTIAGLKNLIEPTLVYLQTQSKTLLPVLIESLDLQPRSTKQVLSELQLAPLKLIVFNYRINLLPKPILNFLTSQYEHYWGSIYLYAPTISSNEFNLKFAGNYQLETQTSTQEIDKSVLKNHQIVYLSEGLHSSHVSAPYRLRLIPNNLTLDVNPAYKKECINCLNKPVIF